LALKKSTHYFSQGNTMNSFFADRLTNLQIVANTVRLEFSTLDIAPGNNLDAPKTTVSHVLVMPIEGFVQAFNGQDAVVKKLVADGVLKTNEPVPAPAPEVVPAAAA
jgi:hypothetical protein